jgi:predicted dehydrogenase
MGLVGRMLMAQADVGFAVVGLGMGRSRSRMIAETPGAKLAVVCDLNEERAKTVAQELRVPYTLDCGEALARKDVEVVLVMTPTGAHAPIAIDAAKAAKHVITTKPLEVTVERCDRVIKACEEAGVLLAVDFGSRYAQDMRTVRRAVDEGKLGRLILGEATLKWYRSQAYYDAGGWRGTWAMDGGGALMNQSIHPIDLLLWFLGEAKRVVATAGIFAHCIETEDLGMALVEFANGAVGRILGTTTYPESQLFEVNLHGNCGGVVTRDGAVTAWHFLEGAKDTVIQPGSGPANIVADMVGVLRHNRKPVVDGREGRRSVELIQAIYQSAREKGWVNLPL